MTEWIVERRDRLRKLWKVGLTAAQIGEELGGFDGLDPPAVRAAVLAELERLDVIGSAATDNASDFDVEIPVEQRRSVGGPPFSLYPAMAAHDCRWPIGDPKTPDFFFCGARAIAGKPYCAYHCRCAGARYSGSVSPP